MKLVNPAKGAILARYPKGHIYQGFGENPALYAFLGINGHNGADLAMKEGTPILATAGVVCEVKDTPEGYGKHIRILTDPDENGDYLEVTYGHLRNIQVPIGLRVSDGRQVAEMSNTGFVISGSTAYWGNAPAGRGVHLHFGVRECSIKNTGWQTTYSTGKTAYIKNYNNGYKGSIDPMPFIDNWLKEQLSIAQKIYELLLKVLQLKRSLNN